MENKNKKAIEALAQQQGNVAIYRRFRQRAKVYTYSRYMDIQQCRQDKIVTFNR